MAATAEERAKQRKQLVEAAIKLAVQSRWEEATTINQQLVSAFPQDTEAWNRLGKALSELGRYEEARDAYERTLEIDSVNQIARKNLQRLSTLGPGVPRPQGARKLEPQLFIEETGKTGQTALLNANQELLKVMVPGEQVELRTVGGTLSAYNSLGEHIGDVEPKLGLRLVRLMEGGNQYTAGLASLEGGARLLIKETYQHPSQANKVSFPAASGDSFRSYTKETILRYELDDEDEVATVEPTEDWSESHEPDPRAEKDTAVSDGREVPYFEVTAGERSPEDDEEG